MFSCACSLRSTQCAALIALAAAAGIMRIASAEPDAGSKPPAVASAAKPTESVATVAASRFQLALDHVAPWLRLFRAARTSEARPTSTTTAATKPPPRNASDFVAASPPSTACPPISVDVARRPRWFETFPAIPSARMHSFPFAVGPPAGGSLLTQGADGTAVPGDSAVLSGSASRIAFSRDLSRAHVTRLTMPDPVRFGSLKKTELALRGESAPCPPCGGRIPAPSGCSPRAMTPGRHGCVFSFPS